MTGKKARLDKLCPALTARERAILVLRTWKEGHDEDPQLRRTMPLSQVTVFNAYIDLMHGISDLSPYVLLLQQQVAQLGLRYAWLSTLDFWAITAFSLASYIWFDTKEPITESGHKLRVEDARSMMAPASELAQALAERFDGWAEDDLETAEGDEEPEVSDKAWNRVLAQKKKELARLVDKGVLNGKRKGRRLLINVGSFYDWLGEATPAFPDWGIEFEVLPDDHEDEVDQLRQARSRAQASLQRGPTDSVLHLIGGTAPGDRKAPKDGQCRMDEVVEALCTNLRESVPAGWREVQAAEMVFEELAAEFDGEDPLDPLVRNALDEAKQELEELVEKLQTRVGTFDLPEPDEALLTKLRTVARLPEPR